MTQDERIAELTEIFYCERKEKCQWQGFALHRGYGIGKLENTLSAWREAHQLFCGGKLIKGYIVDQETFSAGYIRPEPAEDLVEVKRTGLQGGNNVCKNIYQREGKNLHNEEY